jgi:hypothetical protein
MVEFNTGFITAIALFLEHKNFTSHMTKDKEDKVITDLRLYGATDHLYDIEMTCHVTNLMTDKLLKKITKWRAKCFHHRLDQFKDTKLTDDLFKEAEDILAQIDKEVFHTSEVVMNYR